MPKLKPGTLIPTPEEDARIQMGIDADPDAHALSDEQWEQMRPLARIGLQKAAAAKERITLRLSHDVVTQFRATGDGWQTRIDSALRQYIAEHPLNR